MLSGGEFGEMKTAKTSRIVVSKPWTVLNFDVHMIVDPRFLIRRDHPQTPGHTQVHDQGSSLSFDQKIFGSSTDAEYWTAR
jgi:hypothetical protein